MTDVKDLPVWEAEGWALQAVCNCARTLPQFPGKGRALRWLFRAFWPNGGWFRNASGARFCVDPKEYIGSEIIYRGGFEPRSVQLAIRLMHNSNGERFLDIGANQGLFTSVVGCGADCDVVAVEAAPEVFNCLQKNVLGNPKLRATLVHSCAARSSGLVEYYVPHDSHLSAWAGPVPKEKIARRDLTSFWCGAQPLELILGRLDITSVRLMKIDVEGYELEVFAGLDWSGRFRPAHVIIECDPHEREKIEFLEERGYSARTIDGESIAGLNEFPEGNLWFSDARSELS